MEWLKRLPVAKVDWRILITNKTRFKIDESWLEKEIIKVLIGFKVEKPVELSVLVVGRRSARELNIKYRKMNYFPQMLEFPMSKEKDTDGWIRLGDLVICWQLFEKEIKRTQVTKDKLLTEWLVHGITNLLE